LGVDISERVDLTYICSNYTRNNNLEPSATPGVDDRGLFVFLRLPSAKDSSSPIAAKIDALAMHDAAL